MLASVVARIALFSQLEDAHVWRQIVWPAVAVMLLVLMAFFDGEEMLYRTAVPVWMLGICTAWQLYYVLAGRPLLFVLGCIGILFFCGSYTSILAGQHKPWLLLPLYLLVGYCWAYALAACCSVTLCNNASSQLSVDCRIPHYAVCLENTY